MFAEVWPAFVFRWKDRFYGRIWNDISSFTGAVLEGLFGKKKGGGRDRMRE